LGLPHTDRRILGCETPIALQREIPFHIIGHTSRGKHIGLMMGCIFAKCAEPKGKTLQ
jgi:hypothetical protein